MKPHLYQEIVAAESSNVDEITENELLARTLLFKGIKDTWKEYMEKLMNEMNGIIVYRPQLKKDQQIVSGSMKLQQH